MPDEDFTICDKSNHLVQVRLRRDKRLRKTSRWEHLPDGTLLVRVPLRMPRRSIGPMLEVISKQLEKTNIAHPHRTDAELQQRTELINRKHFGGKIQWTAIRWASNMQTRLGSCSRGGPTDGEIRISDKIKSWPGWVIDYVIAHELMHRSHPNHSQAFWTGLAAAYPLTERARGFIQGVGFTSHQSMDDEVEA